VATAGRLHSGTRLIAVPQRLPGEDLDRFAEGPRRAGAPNDHAALWRGHRLRSRSPPNKPHSGRPQIGRLNPISPEEVEMVKFKVLYLSLRHLKDFDRKVEEEAKKLGVTADPKGQRITPMTVLGIEVNP
jgi:hypothetical protein